MNCIVQLAFEIVTELAHATTCTSQHTLTRQAAVTQTKRHCRHRQRHRDSTKKGGKHVYSRRNIAKQHVSQHLAQKQAHKQDLSPCAANTPRVLFLLSRKPPAKFHLPPFCPLVRFVSFPPQHIGLFSMAAIPACPQPRSL